MNIGDVFRAVARPAVTVIFAATIAQVVTQGIDAPEWFLGLAIPVILWWFGERTVKNIRSSSSLRGAASSLSLRGAEGDEAISKEKKENIHNV